MWTIGGLVMSIDDMFKKEEKKLMSYTKQADA